MGIYFFGGVQLQCVLLTDVNETSLTCYHPETPGIRVTSQMNETVTLFFFYTIYFTWAYFLQYICMMAKTTWFGAGYSWQGGDVA